MRPAEFRARSGAEEGRGTHGGRIFGLAGGHEQLGGGPVEFVGEIAVAIAAAAGEGWRSHRLAGCASRPPRRARTPRGSGRRRPDRCSARCARIGRRSRRGSASRRCSAGRAGGARGRAAAGSAAASTARRRPCGWAMPEASISLKVRPATFLFCPTGTFSRVPSGTCIFRKNSSLPARLVEQIVHAIAGLRQTRPAVRIGETECRAPSPARRGRARSTARCRR